MRTTGLFVLRHGCGHRRETRACFRLSNSWGQTTHFAFPHAPPCRPPGARGPGGVPGAAGPRAATRRPFSAARRVASSARRGAVRPVPAEPATDSGGRSASLPHHHARFPPPVRPAVLNKPQHSPARGRAVPRAVHEVAGGQAAGVRLRRTEPWQAASGRASSTAARARWAELPTLSGGRARPAPAGAAGSIISSSSRGSAHACSSLAASEALHRGRRGIASAPWPAGGCSIQ
ncbi:MAG: hypothetical protein KatS3mg123_1304 [Burkholderiales bacterium]|nr:MAG: hypothetical protein KatS3mg123_1304 [Burkholderiales bacterium]